MNYTSLSPLYTDQYTLTMAQSMWRHNQNEEAVFEMFVRSMPKHRAYLMVAGVDELANWLLNFQFTEEDCDFLRSMDVYDDAFVDFLKDLKFTGSIRAIPEGTCIANQTPIISVKAPRIECSIIESALLSIINHQTMIASKASRIVEAAAGAACWDNSLRRVHGPQASLGVARAAFIAGFTGTATVEAGRVYGIPTAGTLAHHFIMSFGEAGEFDAFVQFLTDHPRGTSLLVDTYDTVNGVKLAIKAADLVGPQRLLAIRLDSGDLAKLSVEARRLLDAGGYQHTKIFASNDLDEYKIEQMREQGAVIDTFGVGTMLNCGDSNASIGGVAKGSAMVVDGKVHYFMKRTPGKQTDPGEHQIFRLNGVDTIGLADETLDGTPLLEQFILNGERVREIEELSVIQARAKHERETLPANVRKITNFDVLTVQRSEKLWKLRESLGDVDAAQHIVKLQSEDDGTT